MPEIKPPPIEENPITPEAPVENNEQPTPPVETPEISEDDKEWEQAAQEQYPGYNPDQKTEEKPEEKPVEEPAKPEEKPVETPAEKPEEKPTVEEIDHTGIGIRMAQRQTAEVTEAIRNDVRSKMFPPEEIKAADGTPIKSAADLEQYTDPRTNEPFTKEAAEEAWNFHKQAQQQKVAEQEKQVEQITSVNLMIQDESAVVKDQYGDFLDSHPEIKKEIYDLYVQTLVVDPKTQIITGAPMSLLKFYNTAMKPYVEMAKQEQALKAQQEQAAEAAKQAEESRRQQTRADRSDIFSAGKTDTKSQEDKEWEEAAIAHYGPLKGLK